MNLYEEMARQNAMQQACDASNDMMKSRTAWEKDRDLIVRLTRIEDKLDKLLAQDETKGGE